MKLFSINENKDFIPYKEYSFKTDNAEKLLEDWFEKNPFSIFEEEKVMIIINQRVY